MGRLSSSRFDESFEGRFKREFSEGDLFDRVNELIGRVVSDEFIWRWINGLMDVKDYRWMFDERLKVELRLYWLEEKRNGV